MLEYWVIKSEKSYFLIKIGFNPLKNPLFQYPIIPLFQLAKHAFP